MKLALLNRTPEIFYSIQGEGVSMGCPSIFIRTSHCNLSCDWCDTSYTWQWGEAGSSAHTKNCSIEEIIEAVEAFPCRHLVITGGEPLLQQKEILALLERLPDWTVEIETNGTLIPELGLCERVSQFNVSPKLGHSGNTAARALVPDALRAFASTQKAWFKFVLKEVSDVEPVLSLVNQGIIPKDRVLLMPEGTDADILNERGRMLADVCLRYGFRLTGRLHVQLWGNKKGV